MNDALRSDDELLSGVSVGTFRWKKNKSFVDLPPPNPTSKFELRGWGPYLSARAGPSFVQVVRQDLATIDALSFPLSLLFSLHRMGMDAATFQQKGVTELHIVIAGATAHAEQRLLFDTNYWSEIGYVYKDLNVHLYFVGPEAATSSVLAKTYVSNTNTTSGSGSGSGSGSSSNNKKKKKKGKKNRAGKKKPAPPRVSENTKVEHFLGTSTDFLTQNEHLLQSEPHRATFVIGFNPGFGSGNGPIVASWTKDLLSLANYNIPIIFTQANDYSDLKGELLILQQIIGIKFIMTPTRNAFPMATTAHEPERRESWSCGNTFAYAVQGWSNEESERRSQIYLKEPKTLARSLAQAVTLQQEMDKQGGVPPGMSSGGGGGGGGKMPEIRMRVDEVGKLELRWEKRRRSGREEASEKVVVEEEVVVVKEEEEVVVVEKKVTPKETTTTTTIPPTKRSKEDIAAHRSFMEDLGKTAQARGYMPDMGLVEEYKESRTTTTTKEKVKEKVKVKEEEKKGTQNVLVAATSTSRRVAVPKLAMELDY